MATKGATMRRFPVLLMVMLALVLGACGGADEGGGDAAVGVSAGGAGEAAEPESAGAEAAPDEVAREQGDGGGEPGEPGLGSGEVLPATIADVDQGRVIKEGTVTVRVDEGAFDAAFADVMAIARRLGGGVTASQTSSGEDGHTSGSLTVRVPVEAYEDLLVGIGDIGEVTDRRITAQDVSTEFVDLEARRRQLRAQEEFYLGLLADATAVEDAVRIRGELDRIQTDIERITGRLAYLEDRTAYSTLTVELFEPGAVAPTREAATQGLARYWETGLEALVAAVGTLLVVARGSLPLVLVAAAVWVAVRAVRRRPASAGGAVPSPPADGR